MKPHLHPAQHPARCPGRIDAGITRRQLLRQSACGFGTLALAGLLQKQGHAAAPRAPHLVPKATNVIFCFLDGGLSHVDSFDPKPILAKLDNKTATNITNPTVLKNRKWLKSPWEFKRHGQSGMPISELFPHIARCADDIAVVRSMQADLPVHSAGVLLLHTGSNVAGRPSLGSWSTYGLGAETANLPGFVLLSFGAVPCGGLENYSNGFLPASHQATHLMASGNPIVNIVPADKIPSVQRAKLEALGRQDRSFSESIGGNDDVESAIRNYELAYRMQSLVPDVLDLSKETAATKRLYGIDSKIKSKSLYATQCLRARRLVESGVRFVEITCPLGVANGTWDQHVDLKKGHEKNAMDTDQPIAGLIKDLKQRGMFEQTLIVCAGEFGRTPHAPSRDGRDHHPEGFTIWMAGGGIKGGTIYGATDELGMVAVENVVNMHDFHATILHLLGLDHEKLTFRFSGRDMRLTDVHGNVMQEIIA